MIMSSLFNIIIRKRPICISLYKFSCFRSSIFIRKFSEAERNNSKYFNIPKIQPTEKDDLKNFNLATHVLKPWADVQPNHLALWLTNGQKTTKKTYSELYNESLYLSTALSSRNHPPPKCGLVILPKIAPWWTINLAGSFCEMAISPGTTMLTERDIMYRLNITKSEAIFCDSSVMSKIDKLATNVKWKVLVEESEDVEIKNMRDGWLSYHQLLKEGSSLKPIDKEYDGQSVAQLFFTSGTTGNPKVVSHRQREYGIAHLATSRDWLNLQPSDLIWNISDLGWGKAAYSSLYAPLISGSTIFAHQMPRFTASVIIHTLENIPISTMCLPPTALRSIIQEDLTLFKPKNLKTVCCAGEPLNPEIFNIWFKLTGIPIREGYGQTETTLICGVYNGVRSKPGSIGKPFKEYDVKILDDDLNELGPNKEGQIAISLHKNRPLGLFKGYPDEEQNKKIFRNNYFLTGDKAYKDEEGYICYVGRNDDIIISAGYRIGPYEVESALIEHPAVAESGVVASPDEQRGNIVKAFVVLKESYKHKLKNQQEKESLILEIQNFVKKTIAPYKYPREIEFMEALPKTISGKIRRVELREREIKNKVEKF